MTANNVFVFVPRHELAASENMKQFVQLCRSELTIYEPDFCWDDNLWPAAKVMFGNIDQGGWKRGVQDPLAQPFLDFTKAYFRYRHTHAPNEHRAEMRALKCVERALIQANGGADPGAINIGILDEAAQLARNHYTAPYPVGRELRMLAKFLTDHRLVSRSLEWANPIRRPSDTVRTGVEAKKRREAKLPNQEALDAIAEIFAENPTHSVDIFVTSSVAMLLCSPNRISEVMELSVDCEVEEKKRDGTSAYGWRFRPAKGGAPMIKWIPDAMVDVAKEAVARVRKVTEPARAIAKFAETGDVRLIPELDNILRNHANLSLETVKSLAGAQPLTGLKFIRCASEDVVDTDLFLEWLRRSIAEVNPEFPFINDDKVRKWSDLLFCFRKNELNHKRHVINLLLSRPDSNTLNNKLNSLGLSANYSFFARYGFNEGRDVPLKITSHQFRHLLVTIANRGGLSGIEVARWRGSKDVRQNRAYDQRSEFELVAMLRENDPALIRGKSELEIAEQIRMALPVTTAEFNALEKPTAHITEFGFCVHNFAISPCTLFRDCLNCTEQVCVKGDKRLKGLRDELPLVEQQLVYAKEGAAEGYYGADPWTHVQQQTRDRLVNLISIMEDPLVPDGSIVRLANPLEFSPAKRALRARGHGSRPRRYRPRVLPVLGSE
jgi:hypothetical protein